MKFPWLHPIHWLVWIPIFSQETHFIQTFFIFWKTPLHSRGTLFPRLPAMPGQAWQPHPISRPHPQASCSNQTSHLTGAETPGSQLPQAATFGTTGLQCCQLVQEAVERFVHGRTQG